MRILKIVTGDEVIHQFEIEIANSDAQRGFTIDTTSFEPTLYRLQATACLNIGTTTDQVVFRVFAP